MSGILKNPEKHKSSSGLPEQHDSDHVKFDEEVIQEHDKDRGTRQKISEPKTPYNQLDDEEVEAMTDD